MIPPGLLPAAWRFATSRLGLGLLAALALGLLWLRGNHYRDDRDAWQSAFTAQKAATLAAQSEAKAKAEAQVIATENRYAVLARKADHVSQDLRDLRAGADRFAAARVWPPAAEHAPGGPGAPAPGGPAPGSDRSGGDAVVLTRPEYDQFVANTLRLERVRRWGETLITAKLAMPEVEFGGNATTAPPDSAPP